MSDATLNTDLTATRNTTKLNNGSQVDRDRKTYHSKKNFNVAELIALAARKSGRSGFSIGLEAWKLRRGRQRMKLDEYVKFRLFDKDAHTETERGEFISWLRHNKIIHEVNDLHWFATTEDKWVSSKLLEADGLPVPVTRGIIDLSGRAYHGMQPIDGPDALHALLGEGVQGPIFGKSIGGLGSQGVFTILSADQAGLCLRDHGEMSYTAFFERIVGQESFILQDFVRNCEFLRGYTDTTATIRMVNMVDGDGIYVPAAVLKLPAGRNQADNFWRDGNMLCSLDPETGEIRTLVQSKGPELVHLETHPETGQEILGKCLPHWQAVREVNERVARLHAKLRYSSTDIALTDEGPVVIEVNAGSSFTLPQYASGKGFMTPKVRALFRQYGSQFVWE